MKRNPVRQAVENNYGSYKGAIRWSLAFLEPVYRRHLLTAHTLSSCNRLVFVCQGNICRSAFAEAVAKQLHGRDSISVGLRTTTGLPADRGANVIARSFGIDLSNHQTKSIDDYDYRDGDVFFAMEFRQLVTLSKNANFSSVPRTLLGLWAKPVCPHLHDPFGTNPEYMRMCFKRVESGVRGIHQNGVVL
jgi:protein-tyrosine phosphatase